MKKIGLVVIVVGLIAAWLGLPAAVLAAGGVTGSFEVRDEAPPNPVIDLEVTSQGCYTIDLSWTAPGDDGDSGTAAEYDIRYARSAINSEAAWLEAVQVENPPTPQPAGSTETFTVTGLKTCTTYYFAIKASDEKGNWSGLSNSPDGKTICCGGGGGFTPTVVAGSEPCYLIVDVLGKITKARVTCEGEEVILLDSYLASDANDEVTLQLDSGTKVILSDNQRAKRLEVRPAEATPQVPEGLAAVSPVYDFRAYASQEEVPQPVRFEPPIGVNIGYNTEDVPKNTGALFIAYFQDNLGWIQLAPPEGYIARVGVAAAKITHFTPFAVMASLLPQPEPAKFELSNLTIQPILAKPGEEVTISADLANIGGLSGEHTVAVEIEKLLQTSQVVRLAPEETQEISFTVVPETPGSYRVRINDLKGYFVVRTILPPPEQVAYWWIIPIIVGVILAVWASLEMRRRELQFATIGGKGLKPAPNAFSVNNLSISQAKVKPGTGVTIFAEVTNSGSFKNRYSLVLKIQGVAEAVKEVTLRPGQSQKVAFTIIKDQPGIYEVSLEGLRGSFTVQE